MPARVASERKWEGLAVWGCVKSASQRSAEGREKAFSEQQDGSLDGSWRSSGSWWEVDANTASWMWRARTTRAVSSARIHVCHCFSTCSGSRSIGLLSVSRAWNIPPRLAQAMTVPWKLSARHKSAGWPEHMAKVCPINAAWASDSTSAAPRVIMFSHCGVSDDSFASS